MPVAILPGGLPWPWKRHSLGFVILLAAPAQSSLAAQKKWRQSALEKATSTPKNRVWGFENTPSGRPDENLDLSWETATGSVQFTYESASGRGVFISRDPLSGAEFSQGTNLYAYCGNDPLDNTDPTGMDKKKNTKPPKPITRKGIYAIDDDGSGSSHKDPDHKKHTSATSDFKPGGNDKNTLNADNDSYGVAPKDLAQANGGPLSVGDQMTETLPDGTQINTRIGDFGPDDQNGEVSYKAASDSGVPMQDVPGYGPVPTAQKPIPVTVQYFPGTHN